MAQRSGTNRSASPGAAVRPSLDQIERLVPTPTKADSGSSGSAYPTTPTRSPGVTLIDAAVRELVDWGDYTEAIERWETLTRTAPAPKLVDGPKLVNPRFVEWMMGLPDGWVTDTPELSVRDQLKILGNGVVPQQAAHAITYLNARFPP